MMHVHSSSFKIRLFISCCLCRATAAKVRLRAHLDALDCCWVGFTIKRNPPVVQSFFIIRRNKLDAFDVAAA
jgi:hypothetical protein